MNVVLRYEPGRLEEIRVLVRQGGFRTEPRPEALLFAARPGVSLTAYATGKLLLTGPQAEEYAGVLRGRGVVDAEAQPELAAFAAHAGSDESGKGDYFGPLCVATVHVPDPETARLLVGKGIRDSKLVGSEAVGPLAALVRHRCPHATVVLMPERYNALYERVRNLNDLLAWAHARAIEDLLAQVETPHVLVDQFAHPSVLQRHLLEAGRRADVRQVVRAESDVAVAAASLVARADFLAGLAQLSTRAGVRLPPGAGAPVVRVAKQLGARGGLPALEAVAKVHFATTRAALPGG